MLGERFDEMQDRENTEMVVISPDLSAAPRFGADVERPAVDDAGKVAFVFEMSFDQLMELLGLLRVQRVSTVDFGQLRDRTVQDHPDAVAAAAQLIGQRCPEAVGVEKNQPGQVVAWGR